MNEEDKESEDMTWEEMQQGIDLLVSEEEFEKRYGEMPKIGLLFGWRRFKKWRREFNIFNEGVKFGKQQSWEWIKNSGWLKKEIQEEIDAGREITEVRGEYMYFYVGVMERDGYPLYLIDDDEKQRYMIDLKLFLKIINAQFKIQHPIIARITPVIATIVEKIAYPFIRNKKNLELNLGEQFAQNLPRLKEVIGEELFNDFMEKSKIIKEEE